MVNTLDKILKEMENGVYNFCKDGKCIECGQCCSNILPLSSKEIKEIKRYIEKHKVTEKRHFPPTRTATIDMTCPFLNDDKDCKKCEIYPVRPQICKTFQCNKPPSEIKKDKELFRVIKQTFNMRELFFGGENGI